MIAEIRAIRAKGSAATGTAAAHDELGASVADLALLEDTSRADADALQLLVAMHAADDLGLSSANQHCQLRVL